MRSEKEIRERLNRCQEVIDTRKDKLRFQHFKEIKVEVYTLEWVLED